MSFAGLWIGCLAVRRILPSWRNSKRPSLASDLGARVVDRVMERLKKQLQGTDASQPGRVHTVLRDTLLDVLTPVQGLSLEPLLAKGPKPFVILAVGRERCG